MERTTRTCRCRRSAACSRAWRASISMSGRTPVISSRTTGTTGSSASSRRADLVLRRLRIENLALIREADLSFAPGLNAVTGETGAGKTIFAQAIGLLLGSRADASSVGVEDSEAYVEAELDVPDGFFDEDAV